MKPNEACWRHGDLFRGFNEASRMVDNLIRATLTRARVFPVAPPGTLAARHQRRTRISSLPLRNVLSQIHRYKPYVIATDRRLGHWCQAIRRLPECSGSLSARSAVTRCDDQVLIGVSIVSHGQASSARFASLPNRNPSIQIPWQSRIVASNLAEDET